MDGDIIWTTPIKDFISKFVDLNKYDLVGFKHYCRNTINEELTTCFELDKITLEQAQKVGNYYFENDYKDDNCLIESTLLFRNMNNKKLMKAMEEWFEHIVKLTHKDQL